MRWRTSSESSLDAPREVSSCRPVDAPAGSMFVAQFGVAVRGRRRALASRTPSTRRGRLATRSRCTSTRRPTANEQRRRGLRSRLRRRQGVRRRALRVVDGARRPAVQGLAGVDDSTFGVTVTKSRSTSPPPRPRPRPRAAPQPRHDDPGRRPAQVRDKDGLSLSSTGMAPATAAEDAARFTVRASSTRSSLGLSTPPPRTTRADGVYGRGDVLKVVFDLPTDHGAVSGDKAFVDRLFKIEPPIGADYSVSGLTIRDLRGARARHDRRRPAAPALQRPRRLSKDADAFVDEADGADECLVPVDYVENGVEADDDLFRTLSRRCSARRWSRSWTAATAARCWTSGTTSL